MDVKPKACVKCSLPYFLKGPRRVCLVRDRKVHGPELEEEKSSEISSDQNSEQSMEDDQAFQSSSRESSLFGFSNGGGVGQEIPMSRLSL